MKRSLYTIFFLGICVSIAEAQDSKSNTKSWRKIYPEIKMAYLDTAMYKLPDNYSVEWNVSPVPIPNPLNRKDVYDRYRMPVVKMSGQGQVPMPGTEQLDKGTSRDSSKKPLLFKIIKKH